MIMLIYAAVAIAFLILVVYLIQKPRPLDSDETATQGISPPSLGNGRWLDLSERIFNPSDARWLEQELAFPKLAEALMLGRKRLAIRWLKALQASFDELVRTPEVSPNETAEFKSVGGWQMLWLTLRFKLLVYYALFMVKLFGPYHRLIPSFSWVPFSRGSERNFRRPAFVNNRTPR